MKKKICDQAKITFLKRYKLYVHVYVTIIMQINASFLEFFKTSHQLKITSYTMKTHNFMVDVLHWSLKYKWITCM